MALLVRFVWTALALAACVFIWMQVPGLFGGTFVSEFSYLISFIAIIGFLTGLNWVSGWVGRQG